MPLIAVITYPGRATQLTGRHPWRYGIVGANKGFLPETEVTLPDVLGSAGSVVAAARRAGRHARVLSSVAGGAAAG